MRKTILFLSILFAAFGLSSQCNDSLSYPYFLNFQPEVTISCEEYENFTPLPYDSCDAELNIVWIQDTILGDCPSNVTYIRIWRISDDYGNNLVEQQIINVVDDTPPTISGVPDDIILSCGDPLFVFPSTPTITDNCSQILTTNYGSYVSCTDSTTSLVFVWEATDQCGNSSQDEFSVSIVNPNIICDDENEDDDDGEDDEDGEDDGDEDDDDDGEDDEEDDEDGEDDDNEGGDDDDDDEDDDDNGEDDEDGDNGDEEEENNGNTGGNGNNNLVAICHVLGNGGCITLYVAPQAVPAHLGHGDSLGACNGPCNTANGARLRNLVPGLDFNLQTVPQETGENKKLIKIERN